MPTHVKIMIGGVVVGLIALAINPWLGLILIVLGIGIPVGAYYALDPSQRRRLRANRRRQLGR